MEVATVPKKGPPTPRGRRNSAAINREYASRHLIVSKNYLATHQRARYSALDRAIQSVATPVLRDYVEIPANIIPSTYHVASTAVTGHPGQAARMLAQPYVDFYHDPVGSFKAHPLGTALLAAGPVRGVSSIAGRVSRLAPETTLVGRLGATTRAPRTVAESALQESRSYHRDPLVKAGQVAKERVQTARQRRVQTKAAMALRRGDAEHADELLSQARSLDPHRMPEHEVRRRVDETLDANEIIRRQHRARILNDVDQALPKKGAEAVPLVAQNITRAHPEDLARYRQEIATVADKELSRPSRVKANRELQAQIRQAEKAPDMVAVQKAADRYRDLTTPLRSKLVDYGLLDKDAAEMSPLVPYAVRHMGARHSKDLKALVDSEGNALTPQAIRSHMEANGFKEPAYVTQAPRRSGKGNYYVAQHEAPKLSKQQRTGEATRKGTHNAHPDVLREGAARMQGLVDAHEGYSRTIGEFAHRDRSGSPVTFDSHAKAADAADDLALRTGVRWRPVRLKPFAGTTRQVQSSLEHMHDAAQTEAPDLIGSLEKAVSKNSDAPGPYALIPDAAADQIYQHLRVQGGGAAGKGLQVAQGAFRKTVLATNPRWLFGNVAEAALRSTIERAGPRSYLTAHRALKQLEDTNPQAAEQLKARVLGGGHFTMADRMPKRTAEQFEGTRLEPLAKRLAQVSRSPVGGRQVVGIWNAWTDFVFHRLNQPLEGAFQKAMLGKAIRTELMPRDLVKLSTRAIDQAAHGLEGTADQVRLGREVDRMYGKYAKFSPSQRKFMVLYTPFVAWTLNAVRFVSKTLPQDHPVLTSLLVSASQASEEWRKEHGLSKFIKDAVPPFLQGTIPISGDRKLPASRYTPFGAYQSLPETFGDAVLPQFSGVLEALKGKDWKGAQLKGPDGRPIPENDDLGRGWAAAKAFAESTVPLLSQAERAAAAGGSVGHRATKVLSPFSTIAPKQPKSSGGGSGIDWGTGGSSSSSGGSGSQIAW